MKILVLGDVMGFSGRKVLKDNLKDIININKIDFIVVQNLVPQNNLFRVKMSLIKPVNKIITKYEMISLSIR